MFKIIELLDAFIDDVIAAFLKKVYAYFVKKSGYIGFWLQIYSGFGLVIDDDDVKNVQRKLGLFGACVIHASLWLSAWFYVFDKVCRRLDSHLYGGLYFNLFYLCLFGLTYGIYLFNLGKYRKKD